MTALPEPPGSLGFGILGDRSSEFWKDPAGFVTGRRDKHGNIFKTRLLSKSNVFVCGHAEALELLQGEHRKRFSLLRGYRTFMGSLYGDNVMLAEGSSRERQHDQMMKIFSRSRLGVLRTQVKQLSEKFLSEVDIDGEPVELYELFKNLATEICVSLILDVPRSNPDFAMVQELASIHWKGMISVPINLGFLKLNSGYSNSQEAKQDLEKYITRRVENYNKKDHPVESTLFGDLVENLDVADCVQNCLLLVSALVPKALASQLTYLMLALKMKKREKMLLQCREDSSYLSNVVKEVERMYPPFFAGRRFVTEGPAIPLAGFRIESGTVVSFVCVTANRDEKAYKHPKKFHPERWQDTSCPEPITYGAGEHACLGRCLSRAIINEASQVFINKFDWAIPPDDQLTPKWLPVLRPSKGAHCILTAHPK